MADSAGYGTGGSLGGLGDLWRFDWALDASGGLDAFLSPLAQVLAQAAQEAPPAPHPLQYLMPAATIALLAWFLLFQPQRVKDRKYQQMLDSIKENDHVVTSGGIHGVVTLLQRDQNRVTLRIDDATGARLKVDLWAIARVLQKDKESDGEGASGAGTKTKK